MGLNGKVAVVTGGTRGVGAGIAKAFVEAGADVVTCARRPPEEPVAGTEFVPVDLRDADAVRAFFTGLPRVDVLVNNAGGAPYRRLDQSASEWHARVVELNLLTPLTASLAAYEQLRRARGSVVMIGSVSGTRPSPGTAAYGAAKALSFGVAPVPAFLMGVLTGCAGGIIRDVLAGEPSVLMRRELYVTAAALASGLLVALTLAGLPAAITAAIAAMSGFTLRGLAIAWGWSLPPYKE